jgi:hypothetical protein
MMWLRTAGYLVPSCPSRKEGGLVMDRVVADHHQTLSLEHPKAKIVSKNCQDSSWDSSNTQEVAPPFSIPLETFLVGLEFFCYGVSPSPLFS